MGLEVWAMWCCNVTHFRDLPPLHWPIVALHCSILSPIVQFLVCTITGLNRSVLQDGVWACRLSCVSVYTAVIYVSKFQTFVSILWKTQKTAHSNTKFQCYISLRKELDAINSQNLKNSQFVYHLNKFLPTWLFIQSIFISSKFKFELEPLFGIGRETIFRHVIYGVKNLTAVTVTVLLMKVSLI
jgi:hypothetical protein